MTSGLGECLMDRMSETSAAKRGANGRMTKPVNFYCAAPKAKEVSLAGDFNDWKPGAMERRVDGCWFAQVPVCHGHHRYIFLVDGQRRLDPRAAGVTHDEIMGDVSLLAVS